MAKQSNPEKPAAKTAGKNPKKNGNKKAALSISHDSPFYNIIEKYVAAVEKEGHDDIALMSDIADVKELTDEDCAKKGMCLREGKLQDGSTYFYCAKC